eukprot:CAMPEP_0168607050 /NCGR_PEP_ID=MMETSP0420-20121227/16923_1 /TAXON_ID=498008 /ORGANISM="Pessonella sp." /LENGTH=538 /DNA_ID=CAMNT_0008646807 /DNA_START=56 /DNA_END=1672 /DNA_ORIENTATION=-
MPRSDPKQNRVGSGDHLPEIAPDEISIEKIIGEGSFGKVAMGRCRQKPVAVKILHKQNFDAKAREAFRKEVAMCSLVFHPNICLFMGACTEPGNCMIVTELVPKGDLEKMLHDPAVHLSLTLRMKMARDAALGMNWLHLSTPKFVHRDLKTSNLLVDENWRIKVCDFGLSQMLQDGEVARDQKSAKGTPLWMAPEVMMFRGFTEKCDIYSFGIVLWEILTREEPFKEFHSFKEFRDAVCKRHVRPPIPADTLPSLRELIERCWHPDPDQRPDFTHIVAALEIIIVESAITDSLGREFWKQNFLKTDPVPWAELLPAFLQFLGVDKNIAEQLSQSADQTAAAQAGQSAPDPGSNDSMNAPSTPVDTDDLTSVVLSINCLRLLLVDLSNGVPVVHIEKFGKVLDCFSPVSSAEVLDQIQQLCAEVWFHGHLSTTDAQTRLSNTPAGCFLVRFSSQEHGSYTISLVTPAGAIRHQRVRHIDSSFVLQNHRYASLRAVVAEGGHLLSLLIPCPGSVFQPLFQSDAHPVIGYEEISWDANENK